MRPYRFTFASGLLAVALSVGCSTDPDSAKRAHLERGDEYARQGKQHEAIIEYLNAIQQDAAFGEARLKLAASYLAVNDVEGALREYVRAADLLPANLEAQLKAGELLLLAGQFKDAHGRADKALALAPTDVNAQILRANALAGLNRIEDAVAELETAIRETPSNALSHAALGSMQMARGDRARAEAAFKQAIETDATSVIARLALANFHFAIGRRAEAEAGLQAALALDPKHPLVNRAFAHYHVLSGRPDLAEPYLRTFEQVTPDASGKLLLANYYLATNRRDAARAILEEAARMPDGVVPATVRLSSLALSSGDVQRASDLVDQVLKHAPSSADALVTRAQIELARDQLDAALATVRTAAQFNPRSERIQIALGRIQTRRFEHAEAAAAFHEALRLNPRSAEAEAELGRLSLMNGQLEDAERLLRNALVKSPGLADAHLLLARVLLQRGAAGEAEPTLRLLAREFPDSPVVQVELGQLEIRKANLAAARDAFARALARNPAQVEAVSGLVQVDLIEKRGETAVARVDDAIKANPGNARLLVLAGQTRLALGDSRGAEALLRDAIAVDPKNLDGYNLLAGLYLQEQRLGEARREFERLGERQPRSVAVHTAIGIILQMEQQRPAAKAKYQQILQIDPAAAVAANNLAWMIVEDGGNLDVALQYAQTAKAHLHDRAEVNDTLGWIYVKKGLNALAVPALLQSVEKDPGNGSFHYHLGVAYAGVPDPARARAALNRALALRLSPDEAADARRVLSSLEGS
jgi:tetratricopeptide (TPR) repeat protein